MGGWDIFCAKLKTLIPKNEKIPLEQVRPGKKGQN